jgi:hypothetical protein
LSVRAGSRGAAVPVDAFAVGVLDGAVAGDAVDEPSDDDGEVGGPAAGGSAHPAREAARVMATSRIRTEGRPSRW